jgi:pyruvate dehydrogenase (quinone)
MSEARKMPRAPDQVVNVLAAAGVMRVYRVVGDSLDGLTEAIRRQGKIASAHQRHQEAGAFAAVAKAHLAGELAVCAGSRGPGIDLARIDLWR